MRNALFAAVSAVVLAAALPASAQAVHYGSWGVDLTGGDHTVQPGDNFWSYADGHWAQVTEIPADQGAAGVGADVFNRTQDELRQVIEDAAKHPDSPTAVQIGGLYNAFMDEQRIEALDAKPLGPGLAAIAAVKDKAEFTALMGRTSFGLGKSVVGLDILPDPAKPEINTFIVFQDGLGLPDRDYYLKDSFKPQRDAYVAYIERALQMIGDRDPTGRAKAVMAFETSIAKVSWPAEDSRDISKLNNPMTVAELQAYAPGIDWAVYFASARLGDHTRPLVGQKSAIKDIAAVYADTPLDTLKAWEAFHLTNGSAPYLSKRFVDSRFQFMQAMIAC